MSIYRIQSKNESERGSALAMIILSVAGLAALSAAMMTVSLGSAREQGAEVRENQAEYICQAGLSQAMYQMQRGLSPNVGSHSQPQTWGGGRFWVSATPAGTNLTKLTASGLDNDVGKSQELVVRAVVDNMWVYSLFGKDTINLDSTVCVDSYNSTSGTYASQVSGSGNSAHALVHGTVGSNGDIDCGPATYVWGDVVPGPSHVVTIDNANISGSTAPAAAPVNFPPINVPTYANYGSLTINNNTTTIPSGNRTYTNLTVNASKMLTITGPANVVISNVTLKSNASIKIDDAAGPVTLIVIDNFVLNSNSSLYPNSRNPANLRLNMLSDNVADPEVNVQLDTLEFASNSSIYGCIYAPEAKVTLNSNFTLYGALMARSLDLNSNARFHYDENLLNSMASGAVTYHMVSWRQVPFQD